ncbi:MAG: transposase family protein, partial [Bacteroidota bacterium]
MFADFFDFAGHHYLVLGDRFSGWSEIYSTPTGTQRSGANGLLRCLRSFFMTFGVPEEISSDGGPEFTAHTTTQFLSRWDVRHRISSAHYAQSNGRAEVAVKAAKRLLRSNIGQSGSLNTDNFLRAMLQLRNTPDRECQLSPAEIIFG